MTPAEPPRLPAPAELPLLPAPQPMLLLAAPESRWKKHAKPLTAGLLAAFLILAFAIGWWLHHRRAEAAEKANEEERTAMPLITVVPVKRSPSLSELLLPGSLTPIAEASLYARASGYVEKRYVDIGDAVKQGQILAVIESPELDQQVAQGRAAEAQARQQLNVQNAAVGDAQAKLDLARVTWQRYETLVRQDSIAQQDADQRRQEYESAQAALVSARANVGAAEESVRAAEANTRRLIALQRYEQLRAPFAGIITARNVDEGDLVSGAGASLAGSDNTQTGSTGSTAGTSTAAAGGSTGSSSSGGGGGSTSAGSGSGNGMALFRIAQVDRLRVYVNVPQENAAAIQLGAGADVFIQQFADRFRGRVARTSGSIDMQSRTLLAEVQIGNEKHALLPGMYAQVQFASERSDPPLLVPGEALIARAEGVSVAVMQMPSDEDRQQLDEPEDRRCARQVRLQPVIVGRDYGTEVEVTRGLKGGEFLVLNPSDVTQGGVFVLPRLQQAKEQGGSSGGGSSQGSGKGASGSAGGKGGGGKGGGDKKGGKQDDKEGDKQAMQAAREERHQMQTVCIEDQARQAAAKQPPPALPPAPAGRSASSAFIGASSAQPGGPSDRGPGGIQSPSQQAPTQDARKPGK